LGLHKGRNDEEEMKEWKQIENNAGFYPQEVTPYKVPWDVREATRAMKDMNIDDKLS